jgi:periplasmic copper chaperone A
MKTVLKTLVASLLLASTLAAPALADNGISVANVWGRATPGNVPTGALYLTIANNGTAPDHLIGASSPAADKASVHQMIMNNGVMEMRPVPSLEIMPGKPRARAQRVSRHADRAQGAAQGRAISSAYFDF